MSQVLPEELMKIIISLLPSLEKVVWLRVSRHFRPFIEEYAQDIQTNDDLEKICREGDYLSLRLLKNHKLDFGYGLYGACEGGHLNIVKFMISKGANWWNGSFCKACKGGHLDIVEFMITKGANHWNDDGLYWACRRGHLDIVELIISKGDNNYNAGLNGACYGGHLDIVNLMISKGAYWWNDAFYWACRGGHLDIIELMISKGANYNDGLKGACHGGYLDIVNLMISKGANDCHYCNNTKHNFN